MRVADGGDHPSDPRCDQLIRTRRRAALMRARLQGHIGGRSPGVVTGDRQGVDLGVRLAGMAVPALADDASLANDDTADARVWISGEQPAASELQRAGHEALVLQCQLIRLRGHRGAFGAHGVLGGQAVLRPSGSRVIRIRRRPAAATADGGARALAAGCAGAAPLR